MFFIVLRVWFYNKKIIVFMSLILLHIVGLLLMHSVLCCPVELWRIKMMIINEWTYSYCVLRTICCCGVLTYRYAGPGTQRVTKMFPMGNTLSNWLTYLKSTHKIAIGSLDGRGSKAAGDKLKFEVYRRLYTVEVEDQITAGRCVFINSSIIYLASCAGQHNINWITKKTI